LAEGAADGARGEAVGAGGAADTEIDAAGVESFQGSELLGDKERGVVGEHDAAGADADGGGSAGDVADEDGGGGAGDAGHVVVLGEPVAGIAPTLGVAGEIEGVAERFCDGAAGADGREVEDGVANGFGGHYWGK